MVARRSATVVTARDHRHPGRTSSLSAVHPLSAIVGTLAGLGWGWLTGRAAPLDGWWAGLDHGGWNPGDTVLGVIWLIVHGMAGVAAAAAAGLAPSTGRTTVLVLLALTAATEWIWLHRMFGRRDLRNGFTLVCSAWVMAAMAAAGLVALAGWPGWLLLPLLISLTAYGALVFVVWQVNAPSRH